MRPSFSPRVTESFHNPLEGERQNTHSVTVAEGKGSPFKGGRHGKNFVGHMFKYAGFNNIKPTYNR